MSFGCSKTTLACFSSNSPEAEATLVTNKPQGESLLDLFLQKPGQRSELRARADRLTMAMAGVKSLEPRP